MSYPSDQEANKQEPPKQTKNIHGFLTDFVERGGSLPLLAEITEISASYLRKVIKTNGTLSENSRTRLLSGILELDPVLGGFVLEAEGQKNKKYTKEQFRREYQQRRLKKIQPKQGE